MSASVQCTSACFCFSGSEWLNSRFMNTLDACLETCPGACVRPAACIMALLLRVQHLELIRERAALGKDFERRDSFTTASPGTRCPSPALRSGLGSSAAGKPAGVSCSSSKSPSSQQQLSSPPAQQPNASKQAAVPIATSASHCGTSDRGVAVAASKLNAAAPCFCPAAAAVTGGAGASRLVSKTGSYKGLQVTPAEPDTGCSSSSLQAPGDAVAAAASAGRAAPGALSRPATPPGTSSSSKHTTAAGSRAAAAPTSPSSPAAAPVPLPAEVLAHLQGHSQSIEEAGFTPASCLRTSIKGARRRMAKARRMLLQPG
jgi:hypothetical protein